MLTALVAAAATFLSVPIANAPVSKTPGTPVMILTGASLGPVDPMGVIPTANAVPGAGVNNWDIATPESLLSIGQSYALTVMFSDLSYNGDCRLKVTITQMQNGKRHVIWGADLGSTCQAPDDYLVATTVANLPGNPGEATLNATLFAGSTKQSLKQQILLQ